MNKTQVFVVKGHETLAVPRDSGLCFCLISVLLIYFYRVTYL